MTTKEFIERFRDEDPRKLALQGGRYPEVDMPFALNQIAGWQTACRKLPSWAECDEIIYPPHLSMEQCSSETTALVKSTIAHNTVSGQISDNQTMVDLTGGFGVDFSFLARQFDKAIYVEQQEHLCELARHNFQVLGLVHADVVCGDGVDFLRTMPPVDFIYLDPARRDSRGARTYALEDCTPNVCELKERLLEKAPHVMIKLSPMLDWHKAVDTLGNINEVYIVSVGNECKELLLMMQRDYDSTEGVRVACINDSNIFHADNGRLPVAYCNENELAGKLLFVPNASVMKAGCFGHLCRELGVKALGQNSNLFVLDADADTTDFPGRCFSIEAVSTLNKRDIKETLRGLSKANVAVRNFPLTAQELKQRLKLKDGGDTYIFGSTDMAERHILLVCRKMNS